VVCGGGSTSRLTARIRRAAPPHEGTAGMATAASPCASATRPSAPSTGIPRRARSNKLLATYYRGTGVFNVRASAGSNGHGQPPASIFDVADGRTWRILILLTTSSDVC
jgi:hypothetical protein